MRLVVASVLVAALAFMSVPQKVSAFSLGYIDERSAGASEQPGLLAGIWHGLLAPYSLAVHLFDGDIGMYARNNAGWFYDLGFLIGVSGCLPFGWLAAIIALFVTFA